ncbi:MAG: zf-HC2 domain-containing protein [Planctomycetes bacterium]|nr:zf-HC2 domain-containing protein [Planctomycetota bacterium]
MERTGLCAECAELLVPYIDGELPPEEAAAVAAHLAVCPACSRAADEHRRAWALLADLPGAPAVDSLWPRVAARSRRIAARARVLRRVAAAAAALAAAFTLFYFVSGRDNSAALPDPDLLVHLPVVEQYASLDEAGGEWLGEDLDLVQAVFELTQEIEDF